LLSASVPAWQAAACRSVLETRSADRLASALVMLSSTATASTAETEMLSGLVSETEWRPGPGNPQTRLR